MTMHHKDGTRHPPVSKVPCPHPECAGYRSMTLDLDELERKAKAWLAGDEWLREHTHDWSNGRAHPGIVLALIERVRGLERERPKAFAEMTDEERENYRAAGDR